MDRPSRHPEVWNVMIGKLILRQSDARRALVLQPEPGLGQPLVGTLERGGFVVRVARTLAETEAILAAWRPDLAITDMDHADGPALLLRLGASNSLQRRSGTPILGLTRRADLAARLRAFTLGVDDILGVPFAPEELLARARVISRAGAERRGVGRVPRADHRGRAPTASPGGYGARTKAPSH